MLKFIKKYIYMLSRALWIILKPPSVGVRILLVRDSQILLVKHVYQNQWFLPGGLVERGETLKNAVRREVLEEVGAHLHNLVLFDVYSNLDGKKNDHVIIFLSQDFSLNGQMDDEIERWAFFDLEALPADIAIGSYNQVRNYMRNREQNTKKE